jgi:CheY-like chemotaxis protein
MPHHLLLVDDEAHNRKLLRMVLRGGDYVFAEAESGTEAIEIMEREHIDLMILDLMMPTPNGFEVIQEMRKSERLSKIPFIV